jgi:hypothetical protein
MTSKAESFTLPYPNRFGIVSGITIEGIEPGILDANHAIRGSDI